jgi:hypothetical protein
VKRVAIALLVEIDDDVDETEGFDAFDDYLEHQAEFAILRVDVHSDPSAVFEGAE